MNDKTKTALMGEAALLRLFQIEYPDASMADMQKRGTASVDADGVTWELDGKPWVRWDISHNDTLQLKLLQ